MSHSRAAKQDKRRGTASEMPDTGLAAGEHEAGVNGLHHAWHASCDRMDCWHNLGTPEVPLRGASLGDCRKVTEKELLPTPANTRVHTQPCHPPPSLTTPVLAPALKARDVKTHALCLSKTQTSFMMVKRKYTRKYSFELRRERVQKPKLKPQLSISTHLSTSNTAFHSFHSI